jgi:5-methylthioadenosine/S-adenosylhomocysteine deaminase
MLITDGSTAPPGDGESGPADMVDDCGRPLPASGVGRRTLFAAVGATAVAPLAAAVPAVAAGPHKPSTAGKPARGHFLIKGAALVSVDPNIGNQAVADIEVRDGRIIQVGRDLRVRGAKVIDASRMIAIPGFVETHSSTSPPSRRPWPRTSRTTSITASC